MAEAWLRGICPDLPEILGVSKDGALQINDFRDEGEIGRTYAVRRTDTGGKIDGLQPEDYKTRRATGRQEYESAVRAKQAQQQQQQYGGTSGGISSDDIIRACNVIRTMGDDVQQLVVSAIVRSKKDATTEIKLQEELFELLGPERIDVVQTVVNGSMQCYADLMSDFQQYSDIPEQEAKMPAVGPTVRITSAKEKRKQKDEARMRQKSGTKELMKQQDFLKSLANKETRIKQQREELMHTERKYSPMEVEQTLMSIPGIEYKKHKGYDEIDVPMASRPEVAKRDLVAVVDLPVWAQLAFGTQITHLNQVQSKVFNTAFHSGENMLISAPTGAGKTVCALLTMLHEISKHVTPEGTLMKEEFKMIYICPMKALAQEMVTNFTKKLAPYNMVVKECTGDAQLTKREMAESHLIITTPEKWDVITRKKTEALVDKTNLLIFDEIHLLNEDRGPVIEVLVARMLREQELTQRQIRIVGLSATLPNYRDVSDFIGASRVSGLYVFDSAYRPVPLKQTFIGVKEKSRNIKTTVKKVCRIIIKIISL